MLLRSLSLTLLAVQITSGKDFPSDPVGAAMASIFKAKGLKQSLTHLRFEGEFCMSCDWRRIDLKLSTQARPTIIIYITSGFLLDLESGRSLTLLVMQ